MSEQQVGGTFLLNFIDQTTVVAFLTGDLQGAVRGVIREQTSNEQGILHLTAEHTITTARGDLIVTADQATLTPIEEGIFYMKQTQTIVRGTGAFMGATGTLEEFGAVDMGQGQGVLRYRGQIHLT
jgi:hypothetical protein